MKKILTMLAMLILGSTLLAQSIHGTSGILAETLGNSIALRESGLTNHIFPALNPLNVYIYGHNSWTCAMVRQFIKLDAYGVGYRQRNPKVVTLIDTANDWQQGTTTSDLMDCLSGTIEDLLSINPALKIVVVNTLPYVPNPPPPCRDNGPELLSTIQDYNRSIPYLQRSFPNNVTVVDAYSQFALPNGYGDPAKFDDVCGVHPGPAGQWVGGQPTLGDSYNYAVMWLLTQHQ